MTLQVTQTNFPPSNASLVDQKGQMTSVFMPFLRALYNRTGEGPGLVNVVNTAVAASAARTALTEDWNVVAHAAGTDNAVSLPPLTGGQNCVVFNQSDGAITIVVFPPAGATIDGVTTGFSILSQKMQVFWFVSATEILSTQL